VRFLDIDHFKDLNDRFGLVGGDALLRFSPALEVPSGAGEAPHIAASGNGSVP
jgi:predicted signal transduction protein with EAL and GGDEF domain